MVSVDSYRSQSVRQKSVANSSFQRRRLSADSVEKQKDEALGNKGPAVEEHKADEKNSKHNESQEAECFFVDDMPMRVQLDDPAVCVTQGVNVTGNITEEPLLN